MFWKKKAVEPPTQVTETVNVARTTVHLVTGHSVNVWANVVRWSNAVLFLEIEGEDDDYHQFCAPGQSVLFVVNHPEYKQAVITTDASGTTVELL